MIGWPWRYLGMIGSAKKVAAVFDALRNEGVKVELLSRVFSPVGFPIGSHTPEEIAVSILAEIRAELAGRAGGRLRDRDAPIHGEQR